MKKYCEIVLRENHILPSLIQERALSSEILAETQCYRIIHVCYEEFPNAFDFFESFVEQGDIVYWDYCDEIDSNI